MKVVMNKLFYTRQNLVYAIPTQFRSLDLHLSLFIYLFWSTL